MSDFMIVFGITCMLFLVVNAVLMVQFMFDIPCGDENDVNIIIRKMCKFIVLMYKNRNLFGIFITSVYLLISIYVFLILILIQLIIYLCVLIRFIYNLGYKRNRW